MVYSLRGRTSEYKLVFYRSIAYICIGQFVCSGKAMRAGHPPFHKESGIRPEIEIAAI